MRRTIFSALGLLEILSAGVLFGLVWLLPGPGDVRDKVGRIERVSRQTGQQVRHLREQVQMLRDGQPEARRLAEALKERLNTLADGLKGQHLDASVLRVQYDSLGDMAARLEGLSESLSPEGFARLAEALGRTADYLDKQICPAAEAAATHLEQFAAAVKNDNKDAAQVGLDLARMLRETARLREVAASLRGSQKYFEKTVADWPALRQNLKPSAQVLRSAQKQLQLVIDNQPTYEASLRYSRTMIEGLSGALPLYTEQLGSDLDDQEHSLKNLNKSIDEVTAVMPEVKVAGGRLMLMVRLLLSLVGTIFLLHGGYLSLNSWRVRPAAAGD